MKKILCLFVICLLAGCDAPQDAKTLVKDKHAQLYVFVQRINDKDESKHPTPAQMADMLRASLKDMESLDKLLNDWKKSGTMSEVDTNGRPTTTEVTNE